MKKQEMISPIARRTATVRVIRVAVFMLVFYCLAVVSFVMPLRPTHSAMENRDLATFPAFSEQALVSGDYFDDINVWFADTFPLRDTWMMLNAWIRQCYGVSAVQVHGDVGSGDEIPDAPTTLPITTTAAVTTTTVTTTATTVTTTTTTAASTAATTTTVTTTPPTATTTQNAVKPAGQDKAPAQSNGAVLTIGDSGFEYYHFSQSAADTYVAAVNRLAEQLKGKAMVYDMIVPTSIDICVDPAVRADVNSADQKKAMAYMYGSMSAQVKKVDIFDTMVAAHKAGDYLYFRTDHHWTALGAYRAYEQFCAAKGQAPTPLSSYQKMEFSGYLGSFYRDTQSAAMAASPDLVQAFVPPSTDSITLHTADGTTTYPMIVDVSDWDALYKYNCFIGGDNPLSVIQNPNKTDGSACLLIKESFGNAYAPFLTEDYQTVYVMDYRYFDEVDARGIAQFVTENKIQDVLLLNNISATRNGYLMDTLNGLVK